MFEGRQPQIGQQVRVGAEIRVRGRSIPLEALVDTVRGARGPVMVLPEADTPAVRVADVFRALGSAGVDDVQLVGRSPGLVPAPELVDPVFASQVRAIQALPAPERKRIQADQRQRLDETCPEVSRVFASVDTRDKVERCEQIAHGLEPVLATCPMASEVITTSQMMLARKPHQLTRLQLPMRDGEAILEVGPQETWQQVATRLHSMVPAVD